MSPTISYFGKFQVARLLRRGSGPHCSVSLWLFVREDGSPPEAWGPSAAELTGGAGRT